MNEFLRYIVCSWQNWRAEKFLQPADNQVLLSILCPLWPLSQAGLGGMSTAGLQHPQWSGYPPNPFICTELNPVQEGNGKYSFYSVLLCSVIANVCQMLSCACAYVQTEVDKTGVPEMVWRIHSLVIGTDNDKNTQIIRRYNLKQENNWMLWRKETRCFEEW